jgi:hypothetical protein
MSKEFVEHFLQKSVRVNALEKRDRDILRFTNGIRGQIAMGKDDLEALLEVFERNVRDAERFRVDPEFVREIALGQNEKLERFIGMNQELRDALYSEIIEQYSLIDSTQAASLYRPLIGEFNEWFRDIPGIGRTVVLFTLNYDSAIEAAGSELEIPVIDGLGRTKGATETRWDRSVLETYAERPETTSVVLFKVHGSVRWGWQRVNDREVISELAVGLQRDPGIFKTAVLYPTLGPKPVRKEPFRTGYRFLRACLGNALVLFVIGCSLRDEEIQQALSDAMDDSEQLHIVAISPDANHEEIARTVPCDPSRVAAVRERFEISRGPGYSDLMGTLRGFAARAAKLDWAQPYPFGTTFDQWPAEQQRETIQHITSGPSIRRRFRPYDPPS